MKEIDVKNMVDEIEKNYFEGKNLRKLIQSGRSRIAINNFNNCLLNLKG